MPLELEHHSLIEPWTEADLQQLPDSETDDYEFKSSRITEASNYRGELNYKLCKAASAFWNTGGGIIAVGVDDDGVIDGGIPDKMGKQKLRDWIDQVLRSVVPVGPYTVNTITPEGDDSTILPEHVVLVIAFGESIDLPHMSPDHRYYVRAGAHSNPANHYLVEAIRARRGLRRPMLRGLLREHRRKPGIIELAIIAVSDVPALDVQIMLDPLPGILGNGFSARFPLSVPIIDRENAFTMDIAAFKKVSD
ncbi:MAG: ATP-binding protein, partial [Aggregatilineales bacterium]